MPDRLVTAIRKYLDDHMGWGLLAYPEVLKDDVVRAERAAGVERFWALPYAHKAGVAQALNEWMVAEVAPIPGESLHERLLFGSDCPNTTVTIAQSVEGLRHLGLSARAERALFGENALRLVP